MRSFVRSALEPVFGVPQLVDGDGEAGGEVEGDDDGEVEGDGEPDGDADAEVDGDDEMYADGDGIEALVLCIIFFALRLPKYILQNPGKKRMRQKRLQFLDNVRQLVVSFVTVGHRMRCPCA